MNNRKIVFVIISLIVLLGGSAALSYLFISNKPESGKKKDLNIKRFVKTEIVKYTEVESSVKSKGRVLGGIEVALVSEAAGKIQEGQVALKKGASFKRGDLIAVIYKDEVELALKARKSRFLSIIISMLTDLKIDFPEQYEEYKAFFDAIDINKKLPDLPSIENGKLKVYLARQNFLSEYYGILQDEKRLKRHNLYAPFKGTISNVNFEVGAYVNPGAQVARMIKTDELEIEVPVKNELSKWINIGMDVNVYPVGKNDTLKGKVIRKANFVETTTQSRGIYVGIESANNDELFAGEFALVEFYGQAISDAMLLPRNAVFNSNEVFIVLEGMLKKRAINVIKWNESTLVFNGLKQGDKVVVEPLINVRENTPVGILGEEEPEKKPDERKRGKGGKMKGSKSKQDSKS